MRKGFTLIELVLFIAIFSIVIVFFIVVLVSMLGLQTTQSAASEVNQQGLFLLQQLQYYVSSARLVDMTQDVATSTLLLREASSSLSPTAITLVGNTLYVQQGIGGALQALMSNKVSISNVSFTRHFNISTGSTAFGADSVSYSFTMAATSTNNKQYSQVFQSSVAVFAPVPKIALLQQAKAESAASSTVSITYPTNNETSSLLIALVSNTTTSASVSVADSAGNTWNMIASTSYPAYKTKMTMFDALNAKNSSNTVTVTFGTGATSSSLFIYEYRGASTSSSFDASSSQIQANTKTPSSSLANATSTVELLFGAMYSATSTIPSAGSGFTLETTSTVAQAYAEDASWYITAPVAASWQYSGVTSSSVMIATFQ